MELNRLVFATTNEHSKIDSRTKAWFQPGSPRFSLVLVNGFRKNSGVTRVYIGIFAIRVVVSSK